MADTVDTKIVYQGPRYYVVRLQNVSDGTGESGVTKVTISGLTQGGFTPTSTAIDRIEYNINGMVVKLYWDHTTDDEIATLSGNGVCDWSIEGGNVDPGSAGGTGNILLSTAGAASGDTYDITLWIRPKK